jgi:predicted transposase/invertase (TIGR01784 family)
MQMRKVTEKDFPGCTSHEQAMIVLAKRMRFYQGKLDADRLKKGGLYSDLRPTVIIFFCPFQVFNSSRHVYRFRTLCVDDPSLVFPDECEKIVISSKGRMNDITPDIQALLEYLEGKISDDPLVQEIEAEIHDIKQRRQEESDYMSYLMKMREEYEDGKIDGIAVTTLKIIRNLLKRHVPYQQIAEDTETSLDEVLRIAKESNMVY